jgi:U6 snRNA-associated Sm-like protein LSm6
MENGASSEGKDPSAFLSEIIGAPVIVKLNSGVVYKGIFIMGALFVSGLANCSVGELQSVDGYMNIALEKTEEFVNGKHRRSYGDAFVRGNNGAYMLSNTWVCYRLSDTCRFASSLYLRSLKRFTFLVPFAAPA